MPQLFLTTNTVVHFVRTTVPGVVPKTVYKCKSLNPRPLYSIMNLLLLCVYNQSPLSIENVLYHLVLRDRNVLIGVVLVYCMMTHNDSGDAHTKCAYRRLQSCTSQGEDRAGWWREGGDYTDSQGGGRWENMVLLSTDNNTLKVVSPGLHLPYYYSL